MGALAVVGSPSIPLRELCTAMLELFGRSDRFCSGLTRRRVLQIGGLSTFGLSLPQLLKAEQSAAAQREARSKRSVIVIWQHGGPSQLDTFDMKPLAPREYRGPFQPIDSTLPGLPVCELMPWHAKVADRCSFIRSFAHTNGDHWAAAHWVLTGRLGSTASNRVPKQPSMGAIASKLLGPVKPGALSSVNINDGGFGYHGAAWLGVAHNPFRTGEYSYGNEAGRMPAGEVKGFSLVDGMSLDRLNDRLALQGEFDTLRRTIDSSSDFASVDEVEQRAVEILVSGHVRQAFDLSKESQTTRDMYGPGWGEQALLCRRLIEAGVRYITLNTGYWDDHKNFESSLKDKLPRHDRAVGALIQDLADRGMLDDTLVISAGEFGRTPRINGNAGRDHWPQAQSIMLTGGGYRGGQVIGATDDKAERVIDRPIGVEDVCAIVYRALGLNTEDTLNDFAGRPMHLLPGGEVPRELVS